MERLAQAFRILFSKDFPENQLNGASVGPPDMFNSVLSVFVVEVYKYFTVIYS